MLVHCNAMLRVVVSLESDGRVRLNLLCVAASESSWSAGKKVILSLVVLSLATAAPVGKGMHRGMV